MMSIVSPLRRRAAVSIVALAAMAIASGASADDLATRERLELGRQIYLHGVLPSGQAVRARVQGDVAASGAQLVCAGCHGRSGLGVGEGQVFVPPVAGAWLYRPHEIKRKQLYASRTLRPAYTDEALARAIRGGVDSGGRPLDAMMPHYALGDPELALLISYLKSLSSSISPGVTDTDIHFATVITEGVEPGKRKAMLDVLEAFVDSKQAETRHEASRAARSPFHKEWRYQAYRKWKLHVWELTGPADTWRDQLERHYERQPVFAMIGGLGSGTWRPIHEFCEQRQVPCVLPNTDWPVVTDDDYYSVYFSKGMALEAQVLAKHLSDLPPAPVVQVYRNDERGRILASEFSLALAAGSTSDLRDRAVEPGQRVGPDFWRSLPTPARVVLWLDAADVADIEAPAEAASSRIYVSSALLGESLQFISNRFQHDVFAVQLGDLPEDSARRLRVLRVWMRGKGIPVTDEPLQANGLFAATLVAQALKHIGSNFYRDYFLERIEHIFDSIVTPSAYPRLGLGPNQRFAAKGGYVLRVPKGADSAIAQWREWIVP